MQWKIIVNWKSNLLLNLVLLLTFFLILGCNKTQQTTPPFSGDYPAAEMRAMWSFCVMNFKMKSPYTPPFLVAQICDCYLDEMRATHPHKHINKLSDNETRAMGMQLIKVCNIKPEGQKV